MNPKLLMVMALSVMFSFTEVCFAAEENEEGQVKVSIPATVAGIWQDVKEHEDQLNKIIVDKKLDKVHEQAFAIRDLANALADKSADLSAEKFDSVKSNAKYVSAIASRLDASGDAGDQASTEANFRKLQGFLKKIEGGLNLGHST